MEVVLIILEEKYAKLSCRLLAGVEVFPLSFSYSFQFFLSSLHLLVKRVFIERRKREKELLYPCSFMVQCMVVRQPLNSLFRATRSKQHRFEFIYITHFFIKKKRALKSFIFQISSQLLICSIQFSFEILILRIN